MSISDKIKIVNGAGDSKKYPVTLTAAERDFIARSILRIPQHLQPMTEAELIKAIMRKLDFNDMKEAWIQYHTLEQRLKGGKLR